MSPTLAEGSIALIVFVGIVVLGFALAPLIAHFWAAHFGRAANIANRIEQQPARQEDDEKQQD